MSNKRTATSEQFSKLKGDELRQSYIIADDKEKKESPIITDINQITDIRKGVIFKPKIQNQEQKATSKTSQKYKEHDVRLNKITNKDILEYSNKIKKEAEQQNFLPPDVAVMQKDIRQLREFIANQFQEARRDVDKKLKKHRSSPLPVVPRNFYGKSMIPNAFKAKLKPINNKTLKINHENIKQQLKESKNALSAFF